MAEQNTVDPETIRAFREDLPKLRDRDLADRLGISEAQLVAAFCGMGTVKIDAHPDVVMGLALTLGEVMALTRNTACVHEKVGFYENYHPGNHAAMVLSHDIDLRIFPSHWHHAFMVEKETDTGLRRSLQVFDAAGDAIHKVFLREGSDMAAWDAAKGDLALHSQPQTLQLAPRQPAEAAKSAPDKIDILRKEWTRMTDTHQFMRLTSKLKMNRLGAYRIAGDPFVRRLDTGAVDAALHTVQQTGTDVMIFTGNRGCIQIHTGPIATLKPTGPWQNVMDPRFNLHLRLDHVAEVWAVEKPTQRGMATSLEAFNAEGMLIFQIFGVAKEGKDSRPAWQEIVKGLADLKQRSPA
ncbi:hemin-degrading factor [Roseobacter denitrificans]|uniref:Hemin transport protein n=1 Tax=Roseobacter denitrificans (strain ATCC 33942 / OCh 114) TaxID=375451 RepID=Q160G7_ROSDO|nr:hemin-degrading factor [Roseobacter denitrificans]ABG33626.1 hemin transport protein [Roseobacter denitrificans OCh 114]AVL52923.1 hemin-degrading factor [Roseobacter denitrificans]SFG03442.1 putative hemin transport protein [Roseobacter denitrificans OCh 114]